MIRAISLALGDLTDRRVLGLVGRSLLATLLVFVALALLLAWALRGTDPCALVLDASCRMGSGTSGIGAVLIAAVAGWFLFPAVAIGVMSAYSDRIVASVEARHYPERLASARPMGLTEGALLGLRSSVRLLFYNLLALPFYLLLLVTGVGPLILFAIVNGIAIGADLGEIVAARHGDRAQRRAWLRHSRAERTAAGIVVSLIFLAPIVNLLAPVFGAALVTHLFHRGQPEWMRPTAASRSKR